MARAAAKYQSTCYLCGKPLSGKMNRDHVPPVQLFPSEARKKLKPQLDTLTVHESCNSAYKLDEEYFAYSLGALAGQSPAGGALWRDQSRRFQAGELQDVAAKVLGEFERRPTDPEPPAGKVFKQVDGHRARRVIWKIVRGLYFLDRNQVLPDETNAPIEILEPERECPADYDLVRDQKSQGKYPEIFDYKAITVLGERTKLEMWAMLFWNCVWAFAIFHALNCACDECAGKR